LAVSGHNTISALSKEEVVSSMGNAEDDDVCGYLLSAKQTRATHPWSNLHALSPVEPVHSDVTGPMPVERFGGLKYVVKTMHDFLRYYKVMCVANKAVVARKVAEVVLQWERQKGTM
jgi:hypothetical protein